MRKVQAVIVLFAFLIAVSGMSGCWPFSSDKMCCEKYSIESDQATYCNNHRDAVLKYVNSSSDNDEKLARLGQMEAFYEIVADCENVVCIEDGVGHPSTPDEFAGRYQNEHDFADQDAPVPENEKANLILCGFDQAIEGLKKTIIGGE